MSRFLALCIAGILSVSGHASLQGASLNGLDNPEFQSALDDWLEGNDREALRSLASLARAENRAAQVFLGQVESKPWLHSHVTDDLDREERIELLRNPGGLSGKSWLASAASNTLLAQHFLDASMPYRSPETAKALFAQGELDAALPLIARASTAGDFVGALELALTEQAVPYSSGFVRYVVRELPQLVDSDLVSLNDPRMPAIQSRMDRLPNSDPGGELLWGNGAGLMGFQIRSLSQAQLRSMGDTLMKVPELQPLTQIVREYCPEETSEALATLQIASYGRPLTHITFSPVATILPTAEYRKSARFEADMLRRMRFRSSTTIVQKLNSCAFSMISRSGQ